MQAKKKEISRLRRKVGDLEVEKMESEYQIRQEVCREFHEQLTDIEETHRSVMVYVQHMLQYTEPCYAESFSGSIANLLLLTPTPSSNTHASRTLQIINGMYICINEVPQQRQNNNTQANSK